MTARHAVLLASALVLPSGGSAQPAPTSEATLYLSGTCTNCHGTQGRSAGAMPSLAGMPAPLLVDQMRQFREGKRPATIMHQIVKGYTAEEVERLAEYFARQQPAR